MMTVRTPFRMPVRIVRMPTRWTVRLGHGVVLLGQGEGYQQPKHFEVGTVKYLRVPMRCPKSKFPSGIIVFYKLDLIVPIDYKSSLI